MDINTFGIILITLFPMSLIILSSTIYRLSGSKKIIEDQQELLREGQEIREELLVLSAQQIYILRSLVGGKPSSHIIKRLEDNELLDDTTVLLEEYFKTLYYNIKN